MFLLQVNSPSKSNLNLLGVYILISLTFVFGTMVEFAAVLVAKQRADWNENAKEKNNRIFVKKLETHETGHQNGNLEKSHFFDKCKLTKDMPPYRKMDVLSFVVFSGLYLCFNFIYFITCLKNS